MNTVVNLMDFRLRARGVTTLVLIDLHYDSLGVEELESAAVMVQAIANCRAALKHARTAGVPVAFTRRVAAQKSLVASSRYPRWIEGFEPKRWDMVFDRERPSCYASAQFQEMADEIGGNYVMAGAFGELSCLSTAIDAFHRDHRPVFLVDALLSRPYQDIPAAAMLKAVTAILPHYAVPIATAQWIAATARKVGAGG